MFNLTPAETKLFKELNTPQKLQDYLQYVPFNFEKQGETLRSPRDVIKHYKAHCMEGALFAGAVLWFHGYNPALLDLRAVRPDFDHVVCLFQVNGLWGAISKTNHGVLNYRDPIYVSVRELAISYVHEYFLQNGKKTLRNYSEPFYLKPLGESWITSSKPLWYIDMALDKSKHIDFFDKKTVKLLRKADRVQIEAGNAEVFNPRKNYE